MIVVCCLSFVVCVGLGPVVYDMVFIVDCCCLLAGVVRLFVCCCC